MDPTKRSTFEETMAEVVDANRKREVTEMTREQILDSVTRLEQAKFAAQQKMYSLVKHHRLQPHIINNVIKKEELKAGDKFFLETGFEESDVEPNMKRLDIQEDPEVKAIVKDFE